MKQGDLCSNVVKEEDPEATCGHTLCWISRDLLNCSVLVKGTSNSESPVSGFESKIIGPEIDSNAYGVVRTGALFVSHPIYRQNHAVERQSLTEDLSGGQINNRIRSGQQMVYLVTLIQSKGYFI